MDKIPSLDELLDYGEEFKYPDLIMDDYFRIDPSRLKQEENEEPEEKSDASSKESSNQPNDQTHEENSNDQENSQAQQQKQDGQQNDSLNQDSKSPSRDNSKNDSQQNRENSENEKSDSLKEKSQNRDENSKKESEEQTDPKEEANAKKAEEKDASEQQEGKQDSDNEKKTSESSEEDEKSTGKKENGEQTDSKEEASSKNPEEKDVLDQQDEKQESDDEAKEKEALKQNHDSSNDENAKGNDEESQESEENKTQEEQEESSKSSSENQEQGETSEHDADKREEKTPSQGEDEKEENDFDDLMNNYDEQEKRKHSDNSSCKQHASDKINDIEQTEVYKILKKLTSLSFETFRKGTYKYDKKAIISHYITNQKFKILDDLVSPIYKPDVYVFDLSPSNDESLEMYVNAIGSLAIKDSIIYLTYNSSILRKLVIKKPSSGGIDVKYVVNSDEESYYNFDCTVYDKSPSLYDELREIKNRTIYIFSDFDITYDISRLSQENPNVVWFSTEGNIDPMFAMFRDYPSDYEGYYVDVQDITDIEKYIKEPNKKKYKGM